MKKIALAILAAAGAFLAKKLLDRSNAERAVWAGETDAVAKS